jgi:hypothetical protein
LLVLVNAGVTVIVIFVTTQRGRREWRMLTAWNISGGCEDVRI